jgi:hypothetical protein
VLARPLADRGRAGYRPSRSMVRPPPDDELSVDRVRAHALVALVRGGGAAWAADVALSLVGELARVRWDRFAPSIVYFVLASKLLSGYVGGRVASRAGVSHEDRSARRTMALGVTAFTLLGLTAARRVVPALVTAADRRLQWPGPPPGVRLLGFVLEVALLAWLLGLGFGMGAWTQARQDHKLTDEERSADE